MKRLLTLLLAGSIILGTEFTFAQQKSSKGAPRDPFVVDPNAGEDEDIELEIGILIEYIKLDHLDANKIMREWGPRAANVGDLRDELDKMISEGKAELVETGWVLARSGQRAKTESVREVIYPTEYDPAEIPNNIGDVASAEAGEGKRQNENPDGIQKVTAQLESNGGVGPNIHFTNPNPTAFETRNVGLTIELDPVLGTDNRTIDLNLAPEIVERLEDEQMARQGFESTARGLEHIKMPTFYTIRTTTQLTTISGNYHLLGINTPRDEKDKRIISILKADVIPVK